jgi:hypothetical protein
MKIEITIRTQLLSVIDEKKFLHQMNFVECTLNHHCKPFGILVQTEYFVYYPDEAAEAVGQKYYGITALLTRDLKNSQSQFYLVSFVYSLFNLLKFMYSDILNSKFEIEFL